MTDRHKAAGRELAKAMREFLRTGGTREQVIAIYGQAVAKVFTNGIAVAGGTYYPVAQSFTLTRRHARPKRT
jgi:hypothetical protein